jgi:error-prone DNA polymerase
MGGWEAMLADYASIGMTLGEHPLALLRESLPTGTVSSRELASAPHGSRVRVGGLVVARQRPATANGVVFLLLEDQHGTVNLIVSPPVYERHRMTVRTEPLVLAEGRLERQPGGATSVVVDGLRPLDAPEQVLADVRRLEVADRDSERESDERAAGADFRAVAPAVMSFASGRR